MGEEGGGGGGGGGGDEQFGTSALFYKVTYISQTTETYCYKFGHLEKNLLFSVENCKAFRRATDYDIEKKNYNKILMPRAENIDNDLCARIIYKNTHK